MTAVGDILELSYGKALKASDRDGGDVPVVGSGGIVGRHSTGITDSPTIVVGRKGSIGSVTWIDGPAWPIDTAYFVKPKRDDLDRRWAYWMLKSLGMEMMNKSAAVPGLNRDDVYRLNVQLPPLPEQRRIAAILDHADALRAKRRQVLAHLDALAESIFNDMFGSEIEMHPFGATCDRVTVGVVVRPASYYVDCGVPALRTLNVKPGRIDLGDVVYFSEASNGGPLAKSRLRAGDLVIARTGKAGTTAIVPPELDGANAIDLIVATPNRDVALPIYLESLLNSEIGKRIVSGEARGQIQQHFNVGSLKKAPIPLPPLALQRRFVERIEQVNRQRGHLRRIAEAESELFTSLQSRAFRGEL